MIDVNDSDSVDYLNPVAAVEIVDLHLDSDSNNAIIVFFDNAEPVNLSSEETLSCDADKSCSSVKCIFHLLPLGYLF